jgi:DNA-binding PadR family transcriptional regulator
MLSRNEIILLSILNERPSCCNEINKIIKERNMGWDMLGKYSTYQVLTRLRKKSLVYSKVEKNLRKLNRYYITNFGRDALHEASKKLISNIEWYYLDLNIGFEASDLLTTEEIIKCLKTRLIRITSNLTKMKEDLVVNEMEFKKKVIMRNLIYLREAEKYSIQESIKELQCINS